MKRMIKTILVCALAALALSMTVSAGDCGNVDGCEEYMYIDQGTL